MTILAYFTPSKGVLMVVVVYLGRGGLVMVLVYITVRRECKMITVAYINRAEEVW